MPFVAVQNWQGTARTTSDGPGAIKACLRGKEKQGMQEHRKARTNGRRAFHRKTGTAHLTNAGAGASRTRLPARARTGGVAARRAKSLAVWRRS